MGRADEVEAFAENLRALKERSGRSYGVLATRLHVSPSTLHRYCNGDAVPTDYAPVERFARLCGATPEELIALHRRWMLADARRSTGRAAPPNAPGPGPGGNAPTPSPSGAPVGPAEPTPEHGGGTERTGVGRARRLSGVARSGGSARARLRAVSTDAASDGAASGRAASGRAARAAWRTRPWALVAGAAAVVVLAITAVEVRSSDGGGAPRNHAAATPPASATPKAPATRPPAAGSTARGRLDRKKNGDASPSGAPRGGKPGRRGGTAAATPGASRPPRNGSTRLPLTLSTRSHVWENGCDHRYLIDRPAADVAPPPTERDAPAWAAAHDAVHGGTTNVEATVQGRADSAVVLRALHVRVVGRRTPLAWSSFAMENGCGGALTPRAFSVDLDAARPQARPTDGNDEGKPIPAVRFPYRVSASDPEVLLINARTAGCDCRWYLELEWTSGDRSGTVRIDDNGAPFRTSGIKGRPAYGYDYGEGAWRESG
ncbi:helix-turn-helix domain-containing protein [Streptomyces sp. RTd22]|uniref:helix-turn-helix domain-containing protein n=1 Tax=Streptomyces sp. RTd22 TaxID=1841249 RepID=UPI001F1A183C|nr:helix-turn-helix transcriptional regulator [Streptomyces sp. RTd22]